MENALTLKLLKEQLEKSYFKEDWITQYLESENKVESKALLINTILNASIEVFEFFTLFLLSGEYCLSDTKLWETESSAFLEYLESKSQDLDGLPPQDDTKYEAQDYFLKNLLKCFNDIINPSFGYLFKDLENQLDFLRKDRTFRVEKTFKISHYDDIVKPYILLFRVAFSSVTIEHFNYSFSEETLKDLILYHRTLEDLPSDNSLVLAARTKIMFLMKKLVYRIESHKRKVQYMYSFDHSEDKLLSIKTMKLDESLLEWENTIKIHYGFKEDFKEEQRKRAKEIREKEDPFINFSDFHGVLKIYKDDTRDITQIENLISHFEIVKLKDENRFNQYAKNVSKTYLFNNLTSLKIEKGNIESKDFHDNFKGYFWTIRNFQNQTFVANYFPWKKICEVLDEKIDFLSNDLTNSAKFELFEELYKIFDKALERFDRAYEWSSRKHFLHFQLCYSECQSDYIIKNENYGNKRLFFFSSFVIPIDYGYEESQLKKLQLKKLKFETLSATYKKLKIVVNEVNEVAGNLKNQERRSIEILAVFSAISLFSVGSIQIFTNTTVGNDPMVFYKFILSFGYCLILFVLVVWIITRSNISKIHWLHWLLIAILVLSSFLVLGNFIEEMKLIQLMPTKPKG